MNANQSHVSSLLAGTELASYTALPVAVLMAHLFLHQRNTKYLQIQAAERAFDLVQSAGGNMRVYFGCFAVAVPEQALDVAAGSRRPVHQCVEPRNRRPQKRPLPVDNCSQGAK